MSTRPSVNARLSRRARRLALGCAMLVTTLVGLGAMEIALRLTGRGPWRPVSIDAKVEPSGRLYQPDPKLGYRPRPGRNTITLSGQLTFTATNDAAGHRLVGPSRGGDLPSWWIFGCSYTYGWSVDDEAAWPARLQQARPDWRVTNFACSGYGTVHALVQLRAALAEQPPPRVVVLAYGSLHDERNTFTRQRRKEVAPWNHLGELTQPYARFGPDGRLQYAHGEVGYRELPLMRHLALAHLLERFWCRLDQRRARSHEVTVAMITDLAALTRQHGGRFILAAIETDPLTRQTLAAFGAAGYETVDLAVDLAQPGNSNRPIDGHPSAAAHAVYAQRMLAYAAATARRN